MPSGHAHVYAGHRITSRVYQQPKILLYMAATNCVSFLLSPKKKKERKKNHALCCSEAQSYLNSQTLNVCT